jgi:hypothetical protein
LNSKNHQIGQAITVVSDKINPENAQYKRLPEFSLEQKDSIKMTKYHLVYVQTIADKQDTSAGIRLLKSFNK